MTWSLGSFIVGAISGVVATIVVGYLSVDHLFK